MILPAPASLLTDNDPDYSLINSPDRPVSLAQLTVGTLVELVAVRVVRVDLQAVGLGTAGVLGCYGGWEEAEEGERREERHQERCEHADWPGRTDWTGLTDLRHGNTVSVSATTSHIYQPPCLTASPHCTDNNHRLDTRYSTWLETDPD